MYKRFIALILLIGLGGCYTNTGVTCHKTDVHAVIEKGDKRCIVHFKNNDGKHKDIKLKVNCDKVKYYENEVDYINPENTKNV